MADLEGANRILRGADDRLLVNVEAGVDHARQARQLFELGDDLMIFRVVVGVHDLRTRGAVDVNDAGAGPSS